VNGGDPRTGKERFRAQARPGRVLPVVRERTADWWTPLAAFGRLAGDRPFVFLLESVEGGERLGRYSFLGRSPYLVARARGGTLRLEGPDAGRWLGLPGDPLRALKEIFTTRSADPDPTRPPFLSGAVGYFGYDTVRWVEQLPEPGRPGPETDDLMLLFLEEVVAFDHVRGRLHLAINVPVGEETDLDVAYEGAMRRLDALEQELLAPFTPPPFPSPTSLPEEPVVSNLTRDAFLQNVERAQHAIEAGEIFQVVLSQRFEVAAGADDLSLYRALRSVNPSPYMFLLRLDGWSAVGSSPEPLLRITGDRMQYRPIAGTAPRSGDPEEDARRAETLRRDPKERAEHVMLVDLGRNDLGRSAVPGTVEVETLMEVERYSHVMHLVSGLSARLRPELGPLDALYACFPAGTVSGAPKVRAMQLIDELEPERRGVYGGAVGYLDFCGNLDTCIALRTMIVKDGRVQVQAGAGIVADSDPAREYEETRQKAQALLEAAARARAGGGAG